MSNLFKRTKILATIGPAVDSEEKITELILAGVNGCRFNCSHGDDAERARQLQWVRNAARKKGRSVATIQDLQGAKIRFGMLQNNHFDVHNGDQIILDSAITEHDGSNRLPIQYNLAPKVQIGDPVFLFDGSIRAHVVAKNSDTAITIEAENNGFLMSRKGINLPETDFGNDILTDKDLAEIQFGASQDFDYVALSFVQNADDIENLRKILHSYGSTAKIIAKIETKKAVESDKNLSEIVKASDGIMVARGDMAIEAGAEVVPIIQRKLIALCREHSKLCIVATQMMHSMVENPEPTRAEVSDVATAVIEGADAVMLSDETANGKYPLETVKAMKKVILHTQNHSKMSSIAHEPVGEYHNYDAISEAATHLAEKINADLIVCETTSGATANAVAAQRPNLPILSVTSNPRVANQLALIYANSAFVRPYSDHRGLDLIKELKNSGYLQLSKGKSQILAVIVSGRKNQSGQTNSIQVQQI